MAYNPVKGKEKGEDDDDDEEEDDEDDDDDISSTKSGPRSGKT